ncbi:MAG: topoisomerase subunit [Verrucomicrobiota bacterium]|jgi:topoisomerase IV subunit A|nr:topoisomerase subunit [Verrucomicrobiota bacterium]
MPESALLHLPEDPLKDMVNDNFLQYASYVIRDRAIPQLEDGLKPVQRRILHALYEKDDGRFNKVANIVGHAMQYHPHGDASIEEALVNLVNKSYLIEGQGNFGNIYTGDPPAASRYIECRLTELARQEIFNPKLTADTPSYDGRNREPLILPSKLPLLLMLGSEGIAVGLSTRILPHNFIELLKAQVAILQEKRFKLVPDFPQGGLMDATEYDRGNGKIKLRAKIEKRDSNKLVIREIPFSTTTESVIASIEEAVRKRRIKIRSLSDFTAAQVEILVTLSPGEDPDKAIAALYHFTQCEVTIHSNIVVIRGERPVQMDVEEVIRFNTDQLLSLLKQELELRRTELQDDLHWKSLIQLFIENRLYKRIEECETYEAVQQAVLKGLQPFRPQLTRDLTMEDVEMLLSLQIKRISKFDLKKNEDEKLKINQELKEVERRLKRLTNYAIEYLQRLIEKYSKQYKRKTQFTTAEEIDVRELTANELAIAYDSERGFLGYQVKAEPAFRCSPLDRLLLVWETGRYQMIAPPDKLFVDQNLTYFGIFDREKIFTIVYSTPKGTFIKRFAFGGAIMNRDYNCAQDNAKLKLFTDRAVSEIRLKYRHTKGARTAEQIFPAQDFSIRGPKTRGNQVTKRTVTSVTWKA